MDNNTSNPNINEGFSSKHKHTLMMVLGCVIPILLIGILWIAGVSQNILNFGILLLCPIMHLLMMKNMKHGTQKSDSNVDENKKEDI